MPLSQAPAIVSPTTNTRKSAAPPYCRNDNAHVFLTGKRPHHTTTPGGGGRKHLAHRYAKRPTNDRLNRRERRF